MANVMTVFCFLFLNNVPEMTGNLGLFISKNVITSLVLQLLLYINHSTQDN